jgi:WD40 repeat protein
MISHGDKAVSSENTDPVSYDSSLLKCETILAPPLEQIGDGADNLVYTNRQPAWQCCFSKDGIYLAACYGAPNPCVRIWKRKCKEVTYNNDDNQRADAFDWVEHTCLQGFQTRTVRSLAFAPTLRPLVLASASFDGTVAIWEQPIADDVDNRSSKKEWDCTAQLEGHENEVKCVVWNATGTLLATCGRDKSVWIWECFLPGSVGGGPANGESEFECVAVLNGHEGDVKCVRFAPSHDWWGDGDEIVLSGSYDNSVRVWAEDGGDWYCAACIKSVHTSTIWSLAVAPSGTRFISGSADACLAVYKCYSAEDMQKENAQATKKAHAEWKCVGKLPGAHSLTIYSVDYAPARAGHGRVVSGGADHRIQIYREALGSTSYHPLFQLDASCAVPGGDINCVCWHPVDGSILASAGDDGNVRIWSYAG